MFIIIKSSKEILNYFIENKQTEETQRKKTQLRDAINSMVREKFSSKFQVLNILLLDFYLNDLFFKELEFIFVVQAITDLVQKTAIWIYA